MLALTLAPITVVQPTLAMSQLVLLGVARLTLHELRGSIRTDSGRRHPRRSDGGHTGFTPQFPGAERRQRCRDTAGDHRQPRGRILPGRPLAGAGAIVPGGGRRSVLQVADFASKLAANRLSDAPGESATLG